MKECALVLGPEATGTRLLKRILMANGWAGGVGPGEDYNVELFGNTPPRGEAATNRSHYALPADPADWPARVVWRHSFPMGEDWPDIPAMLKLLAGRYVVYTLVTTRDWNATIESHRRHGAKWTANNLREVYQDIFKGCEYEGIHGGMLKDWFMISYEAILDHGMDYLDAVLPWPIMTQVPLVDGNAKYYGLT